MPDDLNPGPHLVYRGTRDLNGTRTSERILAGRYAGQVRAVVIERALMRMAAADARRDRTAAQRGEEQP